MSNYSTAMFSRKDDGAEHKLLAIAKFLVTSLKLRKTNASVQILYVYVRYIIGIISKPYTLLYIYVYMPLRADNTRT